jgi:small subunit ribosomal protein S14
MKNIRIKDNFNRNNNAKLDILFKSLYTISLNHKLPVYVRLNADCRLSSLRQVLRNPRSICMSSNRSRAVFRLFRLSRIKLRELGSLGKLPGFRKQ